MKSYTRLIALVTSVLTLLPPAAGQTERAKPASAVIGFYHWGGQRSGDFVRGLTHLRELNARITRIALSPRMDIDYRNGTDCIVNYSLPAILERADVDELVTEPHLNVVLITAYDGVGFGDCSTHAYLSPAFYSVANIARMEREYSDFAFRLRKLNHGTARQIILSNWEGDNALYCGSAYFYVSSSDFRRTCRDTYATSYSGNLGPEESIQGMILWHRARYAGVSNGNARADGEGIQSRRIELAPEISAVNMLSAGGYKSVLHDVIGNVPYDYISYSSYESLAGGDPAQALRNDLNTIRKITGSDRIILGEMGFARSHARDGIVEWTRRVIAAALSWGVCYIIQWNLQDQDATNDFGIYDHAGAMTELGRFYKSYLADGDGSGGEDESIPIDRRK